MGTFSLGLPMRINNLFQIILLVSNILILSQLGCG